MKIELYETIFSGKLEDVPVRVHHCLGWVEVEVLNTTYTQRGCSVNPNHFFVYEPEGSRQLATLEIILRNLLRQPPGTEYKSRLPEVAPVVAAIRKAKAKALHFEDHWKEAENHEQAAHEIRRRLDEARRRKSSVDHPGPGIDDEINALESWLGAKEVLGKPAREAVRGYAPQPPPPE